MTGLQMLTVCSRTCWATMVMESTHEVWVAVANQQAALAFLDGMHASPEFAAYVPKANK